MIYALCVYDVYMYMYVICMVCVCVSMCPELLALSEPQGNANYTETQVITTVTPGKPLSQRFDLFQRNQNKIKPHPCKQKSCQTKPNQNKTKKSL